jgi:hypothetical protein
VQLKFFDGAADAHTPVPNLPEGFRYQPELIGLAEEETLLERVRELPFREGEFISIGVNGNRRAAQ